MIQFNMYDSVVKAIAAKQKEEKEVDPFQIIKSASFDKETKPSLILETNKSKEITPGEKLPKDKKNIKSWIIAEVVVKLNLLEQYYLKNFDPDTTLKAFFYDARDVLKAADKALRNSYLKEAKGGMGAERSKDLEKLFKKYLDISAIQLNAIPSAAKAGKNEQSTTSRILQDERLELKGERKAESKDPLSSLEAAKAFLQDAPATPDQYNKFVDVVYKFRKELDPPGDYFDPKYLKEAALQNLEKTKLIMSSRLGSFLSIEDIVDIYHKHRHNEEFHQFALGDSIQEHSVLGFLIKALPKNRDLVVQSDNLLELSKKQTAQLSERFGHKPELSASLQSSVDKIKEKKPYDILGVPDGADENAIKKEYRKKLLALHPDKNPENKEEASAKLVLIQAAYEVLMDDNARKHFDLPPLQKGVKEEHGEQRRPS